MVKDKRAVAVMDFSLYDGGSNIAADPLDPEDRTQDYLRDDPEAFYRYFMPEYRIAAYACDDMEPPDDASPDDTTAQLPRSARSLSHFPSDALHGK